MAEREILNQIILAYSRIGARLFRNNVGVGWAGKVSRPHKRMTIEVGPGDIVIRNARPLHAGLCEGSSDLIGWTPLKITEDDVGKTIAVFTAIEIKYGKTATTPAQAAFTNVVLKSGGLSCIARSVEDALNLLGGQHE